MAEQWQPEFPNQRPPFAAGNTAPLVAGAYSERRITPLAMSIVERARSDPSWPLYLDDPSYSLAVAAWGRAEAVVSLLSSWLADQDVTEWLTETSTDEMEETRAKAGSSPWKPPGPWSRPTRARSWSRRARSRPAAGGPCRCRDR